MLCWVFFNNFRTVAFITITDGFCLSSQETFQKRQKHSTCISQNISLQSVDFSISSVHEITLSKKLRPILIESMLQLIAVPLEFSLSSDAHNFSEHVTLSSKYNIEDNNRKKKLNHQKSKGR